MGPSERNGIQVTPAADGNVNPETTDWRSLMNIRQKLVLCGIAAAAFAASPAFAHPHGQGGGRQDCTGTACAGQGHGHGMMAGGRHGLSGNPAAMVEGHLAALKVELKITADQETAWSTFAERARAQAATMPARRAQMRDGQAANLPAPERLAQRTAMARQHIASMESMTAAVKDLYSVLTPEQKKTADQIISHGPRGGFGGGGSHGRGHGHGPGHRS